MDNIEPIKTTTMGSPAPSQCVKVAVRVRPLSTKETMERCTSCLQTLSSTEILIGTDRQFTFDDVLDENSTQEQMYGTCVAPLVENLFEGFNATILAYGQTGSGKTYTMGSSSSSVTDETELGIIPRATVHMFDLIEARRAACPNAEFYLRVQFLEIYGESIRDLLDVTSSSGGGTRQVSIRDDGEFGGVQVVGATEEGVKSPQDMLALLERGTLTRTTGSTDMNAHSSRSHAIFTVVLEQHLPGSSSAASSGGTEGTTSVDNNTNNNDATEYRIAKFHFVDLAGSERAKRTRATGARLREGIQINMGLLALGNVISALGDESRKSTHVPYRDSKLTRMLQDSLGGNSRTLMVTCVSPADINFEETLNALRYANRARNIKNHAVVNRDPSSSQIAALKAEVVWLKSQLALKGEPINGGDLISMDEAERRARDAEEEVARLSESLAREKRARSELQDRLGLLLSMDNEEEDTNAIGAATSLTTKSNVLAVSENDDQQLEEENEDENENNDDTTAKLKRDYLDTQRVLRTLLHQHETALASKEQAMCEIGKERERFEAMRQHYEAKMSEMQVEVRETQAQRDELLSKLKELESLQSQTDDSRGQAARLRTLLAEKDKRLRELEESSRKYAEAKKSAAEWQQKEHIVRGDIERAKRDRVELQKRLAESTKKFTEELKERRLEVAGLLRERARLSAEAATLTARTERDERLLAQKSEQIAMMQRRLREAQRTTTSTERDKVRREELEKFASYRLAREEEITNLRRVLARKEEAIGRRNILVNELDRLKRAAEERAKEAELELERISATTTTLPTSPTTTTIAVAAGIGDDIAELEQRLEAVDAEISFRNGQAMAVLSSDTSSVAGSVISNADEEGGDEAEQGVAVIQLTSLGQAKDVCRVLMQMIVDTRRELRETKMRAEQSAQLAERRRNAALLVSAVSTSPATTTTTTTTTAVAADCRIKEPQTPPPSSHRHHQASSAMDVAMSHAKIRTLEQRLRALQVSSPPDYDGEHESSSIATTANNNNNNHNAGRADVHARRARGARKSASSMGRASLVWDRLTSPSNYTGIHRHRAHQSLSSSKASGGESLVDELLVVPRNTFVDASHEVSSSLDLNSNDTSRNEYEAILDEIVMDSKNNPMKGDDSGSSGAHFSNIVALFAEAETTSSSQSPDRIALMNSGDVGFFPGAPGAGWVRVANQTTESYSKKRALDAEDRQRRAKPILPTTGNIMVPPSLVAVQNSPGKPPLLPGSKENGPSGGVHQRLNDPKYFTGTQRQRLAHERARRKAAEFVSQPPL